MVACDADTLDQVYSNSWKQIKIKGDVKTRGADLFGLLPSQYISGFFPYKKNVTCFEDWELFPI